MKIGLEWGGKVVWFSIIGHLDLFIGARNALRQRGTPYKVRFKGLL